MEEMRKSHKFLVVIAGTMVGALWLFLLLSCLHDDAEFSVTASWGFSVRKAQIAALIDKTNGETWFTNRISRIGPIQYTEFNSPE